MDNEERGPKTRNNAQMGYYLPFKQGNVESWEKTASALEKGAAAEQENSKQQVPGAAWNAVSPPGPGSVQPWEQVKCWELPQNATL